MIGSTPIEIERKFLIYMPDTDALKRLCGIRIKSIWQTYLLTDDGSNARVRRIVENGKESFVKTVKRRISTLSCYEEEGEISADEYLQEMKRADHSKSTIEKTRYAFPYGNHTVEIDVYPFWSDRAILEVELASEEESFSLPDFIKVIREVSEDKRYKNTNLAICVPMDTI